MRSKARVVISGIGVVAPNGIGRRAYWDALVTGKSGIDSIASFDAHPYPCKVAAEVKDFHPTDFMSKRRAKELWRFTQFAVAAARMAADDAKLEIGPHNSASIGVCFGTCVNGVEKIETSYELVKASGYAELAELDRFAVFEYSTHAPASYVAIDLGMRGPTMTLASGCSTGLDVIQWAAERIRDGSATAVVAGSTEAPLTPFAFASFCAVGVLAKPTDSPLRSSRPYDLTRDGIVLGEGGGAVVVESLESAIDRGAPIYAEITGFGLAGEAKHLLRPDSTGEALARAINYAVRAADCLPTDIDYVNGHGNSLPDYDAAETTAFKRAFGERVYSIPISSIKSMIGQPLAASGVLQAISTALTVANDIIPPTINYEIPDPNCDLDYVPNFARVSRVQRALANAHSIGGTHSVLLLEKPRI